MTRPEERRIKAADGTSLRVAIWHPEGTPRFVVAMVHGQSEHILRHTWLAERITAAGGMAFGHDHRGEGRSGGHRGHVERFEDFVGDMHRVFWEVTGDLPEDCPRLIYAHSMGALIAMGFLLDRGADAGIRAAVLSSPFLELAMEVSGAKRFVARAANFLAPKLAIPGNIPAGDVAHDPDLARAYEEDPDRTRTVTPRWVACIEAGQARVIRDAHRLEIPLLWLHGSGDRICKFSVSKATFDSLPRAAELDQTFEEIEGGYHELHNELPGVRGPVRERVATWLVEHATA